MSKRKDKQAEYKHLKKFLESSKDSLKRLKSLNQGLEKSSDDEIKTFYSEHSSAIFYCVYSSFTIIEANIHDRVVKGKGYSEIFLKDMMELVLPALQKVLEFLPELVHKGWQFNSICTILRKLFHPQNGLKMRQSGIVLLLLWVQALQENAGDACMELFASVIPFFPPEKTPMGLPTDYSSSLTTPLSKGGLSERYGAYSSTSLSKGDIAGPMLPKSQSNSTSIKDAVNVGMIYPLSPPPTTNQEAATLELTEFLLKCLTSQMYLLRWEDPSMAVRGFGYLFFLFKLFYLAPLYKEFRTQAGLYTQSPPPRIGGSGEPDQGLQSVEEEPLQDSDMSASDRTQTTPPVSRRIHGRSSPYRMSSVIKLEYDTSHPIYVKVQDLILKYLLMWVLPSSRSHTGGVASEGVSTTTSSLRSDFSLSSKELMREMWFTNQDNVSLLLEICRFGFRTPLSQVPTLRKLVDLYFHWEQTAQKPPFMCAPPVQSYGETTPSLSTSSDHDHSAASRLSILSWEQLSCYEGFKPKPVQAGMQPSLRMIVSHTSQVFLKKAANKAELENQVEMCRKILRLYQDIAVSGDMDHKTWEYSLDVLLYLTEELLPKSPPLHRDSALGGMLAELLLRTLLVYFVRASMSTKVSPRLWDDLLSVASSLTLWKEVIIEWQFVMDSMTSILAQTVYSLNLSDLPLDRLEKDDHVRGSRRVAIGKEIHTAIHLDSFSAISSLSSIRSAQRRDTADGRIRHSSSKNPHIRRIGKCSTEMEHQSPHMEGHPGKDKRVSLPHTFAPLKTTIAPLAALGETKEGLASPLTSPESVMPPIRSITTSTLVSGKLAEDRQASVKSGSIPSPGAISLPAEFVLGAGESSVTPEEFSPINTTETQKTSLFVNPDTSTPSPDSVFTEGGQFFAGDEPSKKPSSLSESSKTSKKSGLRGKFGQRSSKTQLPPDLVLTNHSIGDTEQESLKSRHPRYNSEEPANSPLTVIEEDTDSPALEKRRSAMCRSSSEGNIHQISSSSIARNSPKRGGSESGRVMRRVVSTTMNQDKPSDASDDTFAHAASSPSISPPVSAKRFDVSKRIVRMSGSPPTSPARSQGDWSAESAAIVWQRMLKILGDVNEIEDPDIHSEAMTCLEKTWKSLASMSANLGIPIGSSPTPPLPEFVPSLSIFLPWVIRACSLSHRYYGGRIIAYKLLCHMIIRHWHTLPSEEQLAHFFRLMHNAFQPNSDMLLVAVKSGCKLFAHSLPGSSILLKDSIKAIDCVLSSSSKSGLPRNEALHLLGSLLCLPDQYTSVPVLCASCEGVEKCTSEDVRAAELKEQIVQLLYRSAKTESFRNSRCLAIFQTGLLLFNELQASRESPRIPEGVEILLATLKFSDRTVSMAAADMLSLLVEVAPQITSLYPSLPAKILQAICYAIKMFLCEEAESSSWLDKIVVTLILCLRDWLVALPIPQMVKEEGLVEHSILTSVFEVLQFAAGISIDEHRSKRLSIIKNPVSVNLSPIDHISSRSPRGEHSRRSRKDRTVKEPPKNGEDVQLSFERQVVTGSSSHQGDKDKIQIAARSVITHLINLLGHFPFACGSAQMGSVVCEYHDYPSLDHLHELSPEIFDSPRVQFFSFNDTTIVTLVEIPAQPSGVPSSMKMASYQTRVIVRDVSGKYTWDCAMLYGPEKTATHDDRPPLLTSAETVESLTGLFQLIQPPLQATDPPTPPSDPLQPPSWRTHTNSDRDVLEDLLLHVESTSPECLLYPGTVGLCEAVPVGGGVGVRSESVREVEEEMVCLLDQQLHNEQEYTRETRGMPNMQGEKATAPQFNPSLLAFHHCRLFLSHLGMLSWEKRNHLDLLEKSNQLILELKHLDNIQAQTCRQTYKVAVLYIAPGQEDKSSIFSNSGGSREYEEFLAGLGWEVEMKTHTGYMGGLKREFCADCTLPYYATSSEEVLFHVATRLPLKMDQKVRHLGNDFVHIVWSEHWRDYRRTTFKTQFGDVLIIIYPQTNGLFRVQINIEKKSNVAQFGPLFDGALVPRESLSALVRATAINGLRALRSALIGSRGRYEERLQNIHAITKMKMMSSFEEFSEHVMHPLEMTSSQPIVSLSQMGSPQKPRSSSPFAIFNFRTQRLTHPHKDTSSSPHSHSSHLPRSHSPHSHSSHLLRSHSPKSVGSLMSSFLKIPALKDRAVERFSPPMRKRSNTNDDRMQASPKVKEIRRNSSVPENLSEIGKEISKSDSRKSKSPDIPHSLTASSMY